MKTQTVCKIRHHLNNSLKVLELYKWLLDSFVLDYFVEDHWAKLPSVWSEMLSNIEPPELCELLRCESSQCRSVVWPLSLLALQAARQNLALPRETMLSSLNWLSCDCICCGACSLSTVELYQLGILDLVGTDKQDSSCWNVINGFLGMHSNMNNSTRNLQEVQGIVQNSKDTFGDKIPLGLMNSSSISAKIVRLFEKHVKPKKRHEIFKMAQVAAWTARLQRCHCIVDVGSGVGHLARMLAYGFGLRVCCLEAQDALTTQARKLDDELKVALSKYISQEELSQYSQPVHLNITMHPNVDPADFVHSLSAAFGNILPSDLRFGIVGLHPCGDLGPILLKLFQQCPGASFVNIVGCCYMKISHGLRATFQGYPMSDFVSQQYHMLSYEARELSCHAVEAYSERLASGKYSDLMVHCFRAELERIIVKHWPHLRHSGVRSVKHNSQMTFAQYCATATDRLNISIPVEDLNSDETTYNLEQWKRVVTFYTLRLLLAPLVESVILLDRVQCLRESGIGCTLIPVFEPRLSPRNHVLVATKEQ